MHDSAATFKYFSDIPPKDTDTLRRVMKARRKQLHSSILHAANTAFARQLRLHPAFLRARRVGFYLAHMGEVPMQAAIASAWAMNKTVALPRIHPLYSGAMMFKAFTPESRLQTNRWGLREPAMSAPTVAIQTLDCVVVPLVAVDAQGYRMGQGGGFYDRAFSQAALERYGRLPTLLGAAYDFQCVSALDAQPWDVPVDDCIVVASR